MSGSGSHRSARANQALHDAVTPRDAAATPVTARAGSRGVTTPTPGTSASTQSMRSRSAQGGSRGHVDSDNRRTPIAGRHGQHREERGECRRAARRCRPPARKWTASRTARVPVPPGRGWSNSPCSREADIDVRRRAGPVEVLVGAPGPPVDSGGIEPTSTTPAEWHRSHRASAPAACVSGSGRRGPQLTVRKSTCDSATSATSFPRSARTAAPPVVTPGRSRTHERRNPLQHIEIRREGRRVGHDHRRLGGMRGPPRST